MTLGGEMAREPGWDGRDRRRTPRTITPESTTPLARVGSGFPLTTEELRSLVRAALDEDGAFNDLTTTATVLSNRRARGHLVARGSGVVAGIPLAVEAFCQLDPKVTIRIDAEDGTRVVRGTSVLFLSGHARALLSAERVALNFMQRLSGIATLTRQFVDAVAGTGAKIYDTRKTTPGWRLLEKYAVRCAGGMNHRLDLSDAILIKDNHLAALDGNIELALKRVRKLAPEGARIEVECDRVDQVRQAIDAGADAVLLDNMSSDELRECVTIAQGRALTEASGGIRLDTVRKVAETGVDWISIGALTHSAISLDIALDFETVL